MFTPRQQWGAIIAANAAGAALVVIGAAGSAALQASGLLLLFPGSLVAAVLPLQKLWHPVLWRCCQTDSAGLSNILYLPVAVLTNLLVWWAIKLYWARRGAT
jgi:hypothetical protein